MSDKIIINSLGFREYDARWIYEKDINFRKRFRYISTHYKNNPRVVVGHDYRI